MKKHAVCGTVLVLTLALAGCGRSYKNIGPNEIGMMLTPSGYENKIYSPGQINLGTTDNDGQGNTLVLIQRSGIQVKESFDGAQANPDHEDHRCLTKDNAPVSLDVRLLFALPDYNTPDGLKDLKRIFLLGNPSGDSNDTQIQRISAQSVYEQQAQQAVRGKIRQICVSYANFDAMNTAFADTSDQGLVHRIETSVADVMRLTGVPLRLVSAYPSNMKPDPVVVNATVQQLAAEKQNLAIKTSADFIGADPTGTRRLVYQMQQTQELVAKANANGHNTVIMGPGAASAFAGH